MGDQSKIAEYQETVRGCALTASILTQYDLPKLLEAIGRAEAFGPLLDPTLYREKAGAMDADRELLEAALPLWRFGKKMKEVAERTRLAEKKV